VFTVLHEDAHLLVVDKAAGILTVPAGGESRTLFGALKRYLGLGERPGGLYVVQRLDRDTSGVIVFARTREAAEALEAVFAAHEPERVYHAIVAGNLADEQGAFRSRLATGPGLQQRSTRAAEEGKPAVTHYRVTARLPGATAVEVRLETGRRNQIRVHFAEAGHPVLGDRRYAPEAARHRHWPGRRLALHAAVLAFRHPVTGEALRFESPLPPEFTRFRSGGRRPKPGTNGKTTVTPPKRERPARTRSGSRRPSKRV
jgi:23S rRNA pseudouridine1911/1915/1917 synthase